MMAKDHLLTLKVMRLSRPNFHQSTPIFAENDDLIFDATNELQKTERSLQPLGDTIMLPQNFGTVYLGEKFVSYVRVSNSSGKDATDYHLRAELSTASHRVLLFDSSTEKKDIPNGQSVDTLVTHEVKEMGKHTLVCQVAYTTAEGFDVFFRKSFKFVIKNPLAVKTKVYNVEKEVFLEAQVQNLIAVPMMVESMRFDPNPLFVLSDLNSIEEEHLVKNRGQNSNGDSVCIGDSGMNARTTMGRTPYINSNDIRQYLYRLAPRIPDDPAAKVATVVGKLDISWRSSMGEVGRLQTSQLPRKVKPQSDLTLTATSIPEKIVSGSPFSVECVLANLSDRRMSLRMVAVKSKMSAIVMNGISGQHLGEVNPNHRKSITLSLFALKAGLHPISGLRITDLISGRSYDIENLKDVLVLSCV
eukprot:CFRG6706T1